MADTLKFISVRKLEPDPNQPRKELEAVPSDTEFRTLRGLADSLLQVGMLQPIRVQPIDASLYRIISGHRRYAAAQLAGLKEVPCLVTSQVSNEQNLRIMQITENVQRKAMTTSELIQAVDELVHIGLTQAAIAKRLGIGADRISILMNLSTISEQIRKALDSGLIDSPRAAYDLNKLPESVQENLIKAAQEKGKPLTQTDVRRARTTWQSKASGPHHPFQAPLLPSQDYDALVASLDDGIEDTYDAEAHRNKFFGRDWRQYVGKLEAIEPSADEGNELNEASVNLPSLTPAAIYVLVKQLGIKVPKELSNPKKAHPDALAEWLAAVLPAHLLALSRGLD